jgi:hypothetical protein
MHGGTYFIGEARGFQEGYCVTLLTEEDSCAETANTGADDGYVKRA